MKEYTVKAVAPTYQIRAWKHGMLRRKGGEFIAAEKFQFPETPYYLACEMMQDKYPNATILLIQDEDLP